MQSEEFITACKQAVIEDVKEKYNEVLIESDLHLVWFSKALENFKCILIDLKDNQRMYECTFSGSKREIYVDIYEKQLNKRHTYL